MAQLTELYLSRNRIGDLGFTSFSSAIGCEATGSSGGTSPSFNLKNLTKLSVNHNRVGDEGIKAFTCAIANGALPQLSVLRLEGNMISDDGIEFFSYIVGRHVPDCLRSVTKLYLHQHQMGDKGAKALATAITSGALSSLKKAVICSPHAKNAELKAACRMRLIELQ